MTTSPLSEPTLGVPGFTYRDLRDPARLPALTEAFYAFARARAAVDAWARFERYRDCKGEGMAPEEISEALVTLAPYLGAFVSNLFGIDDERERLIAQAEREGVIFRFKREFVKKRVVRRKKGEIDVLDAPGRAQLDTLARAVLGLASGVHDDVWNDEREVAESTMMLHARSEMFRKALAHGGVESTAADREDAAALARKLAARSDLAGLLATLAVTDATTTLADREAAEVYAAVLDVIDRWCALRMHDAAYDHHWVSLRLPKPLDYQHLVHLRRPSEKLPEMLVGPEGTLRARDGFALTDARPSAREIHDNADYCIYCHDRNKDSCSKGIHDKTTGAYKANPLGTPLTGCPLEEKISEANYLKNQGASLSALAVVMIDNPMCPGTGHRICNDCMKACIYQKQTPVNIPAIETAILTDVLNLRWGFEIYDLFTRWNPLNVHRPHALPYNGKNVLVVGLGPAGYTLAQHLLNEGFGVVGVDGLKIEPLSESVLHNPVERWSSIYEALDDRVLLGFGGVSEYGITVRWDKNFLNVIYVTLARRPHFKVYGGVRFGGTIDLDDAWKLGFHHVAIAAGAGKPTLIDMPNGLARGIRQASDFLMALQLTGAYKRSSLANLNVRLPGLVIGGGLTGIDTATEMRAYYVVQSEKALERYETLVGELGEPAVMRMFDGEEREVLLESVEHGRAIRAERERAAADGRVPDFNAMIDAWGGVTLAYRRTLHDSPAYRLNHEEVEKFLEEGVRFMERVSPKEALVDAYGAVRAVVFDRMELHEGGKLVATGQTVEIEARTVCIAAGTSPNVTYDREFPEAFEMDAKTKAFRSFAATVDPDGGVTLAPSPTGFFTSYQKHGHLVSYYGDNHPVYAGSVVRAMASAKDGYPFVVKVFEPYLASLDPERQMERNAAWQSFVDRLDEELVATVVAVNRLTPTIVEVVVKAPAAARRFQPGQFYRLQNFESNAPLIDNTRLAMEGLALTGAATDAEKGLLSTIVLEYGASTRLCAALRVGEPVVLMGPTGTPTEIPKGETVVLAGGGLGNAVLFSIGKALRANGCKVLYFAAYRKADDVYKMEEIEASADQVIWSLDVGPAITPRRPSDHAIVGNVVQAMVGYATGELGEQLVDLGQCERLVAIGSDRMMNAVKAARHGVLKPHLKPSHVAIGSINSPMQCMMKEICAQCLQRQVDPVTGKVTVVFTCFNQDQELDRVDFDFLNSRLRQASVQEKMANLWLSRLLTKENVLRV